MAPLPVPLQGPTAPLPPEEGQEAVAVPCPGPSCRSETLLATATGGAARRAACVPPAVAQALLRSRVRARREAGVAAPLEGVAGVGGLLQPPLLPSAGAVTPGVLVGHFLRRWGVRPWTHSPRRPLKKWRCECQTLPPPKEHGGPVQPPLLNALFFTRINLHFLAPSGRQFTI